MAVAGGPTLEKLVTRASVENALRVPMAVSGSTNAVIHLAAIAGRLGIDIDPDRLNAISAETPVLVDLKPPGNGCMEDFHHAGGLDGVLRGIESGRVRDWHDITGQSIGQRLDRELPDLIDPAIIRPASGPIDARWWSPRWKTFRRGSTIRRSTSPPTIFSSCRTTVPAVLRGCPKPVTCRSRKNAPRAGVKDMVRISDARMSGTGFGTIVLHVTPEADPGGPLALVRDGDRIRLSAENKSIDLLVPDGELDRRRAALVMSEGEWDRGYRMLSRDHVLPTAEGCDFDFLRQRK